MVDRPDSEIRSVFDLEPDVVAGLHPNEPQYWANLWAATQRAAQATGSGKECWQGWDNEADAREYWGWVRERDHTQAPEDPGNRTAQVLAAAERHFRVLDIGAGPGNITLPLAANVAHVTAVEPAAGMATVLRENVVEAGVNNVTVVQKRWDDVDVETDLEGPFDLVVVSFAFGMNDLYDTIKKILAVGSGQVIFYWHAGPQSRDRDSAVLWPKLFNRPFVEIPKANLIINLLYTMELYPNVTSIHRPYVVAYPTLDDAIDTLRRRYDVEENDTDRIAMITDYVKEHMVETADGWHHARDQYAMKITWDAGSTSQ